MDGAGFAVIAITADSTLGSIVLIVPFTEIVRLGFNKHMAAAANDAVVGFVDFITISIAGLMIVGV